MSQPDSIQFKVGDSLNILNDVASNKKVDPDKLANIASSIISLVQQTNENNTPIQREWAAVQLYVVAQKAQTALESKNLSESHRTSLETISQAYSWIIEGKSPSTTYVPDAEKWLSSQAETYKSSLESVNYNDGKLLLPSTLVMESHVDSLVSTQCNKPLVQEYAINGKAHENAQPVKGSGESWNAKSVEKQRFKFVSQTNQVVPSLQSPSTKASDLTNIHYQTNGEQVRVSTGEINTIDKAKELMSVIEGARNGKKPTNIVVLQFDSTRNAAATVRDEHNSTHFMNRQLGNSDNPNPVAHINLSLDGSNSYSQSLHGISAIASQLNVPTISLMKMSTELNLSESRKFDLEKQIEDINRNLKDATPEETAKLKADLQEKKNEISSLDASIAKLIPNINKELSNLIVSCKERAQRVPKLALSLTILASLISQYPGAIPAKQPPLSRTAEIELHLLLAKTMSNSTLVLTDKDGLDETGFVKALADGLDALVKKFEGEGTPPNEALEKAYQLILKMDEHSAKIDSHIAPILDQNRKDVISDLTHYETTPENDFHLMLKAHLDNLDDEDLQNAWFYKQQVALNLFKVALPATIEGTGLVGLDLAKYPDILKRLPNALITDDNKVIQLYTRTTGMFSGFFSKQSQVPTEAGAALIFRNAKLRTNE